MNDWKRTKEETPLATGRKVLVWMEDENGRIVSGTYAESLCDAGDDARGYWLDEEGKGLRVPVRWMARQ